MSAHRQVSVRGIEVTRCRVDEVPLSLVVLGQVEGGQKVESPRGRRIPLGIEASRHALGELRDLGSGTDAGKGARRQPIHSRPVQNRSEVTVELQVKLAVAGVFGEHASTVSPVYVRWTAQ